MNLNKAMIIGRITQDLELKKLPNGNEVLSFSVATNYNYKDKNGQKVEQTEFHNVVFFGKRAGVIAQYFIKGQEIYVEGRLQTQSWEDKDTGKKMYRTEIIGENFEFGPKPSGNNSVNTTSRTESQSVNTPVGTEEDINPEDIPF